MSYKSDNATTRFIRMDRPIPPFYCVYLLRSTKPRPKHGYNTRLFYVGSTPHPSRRLAQHNGRYTGGANRTSNKKQRPWRMILIVCGFPSKIAALQFEWAFQNPEKSRHSEQNTKPHTLDTRLSSLKTLLRSMSFARWPLELRFFYPEVLDLWRKTSTKSAPVSDVPVHAYFGGNDESSWQRATEAAMAGRLPLEQPQLCSLDVSYQPLKQHLEKSESDLADGIEVSCAVCKDVLSPRSGLVVTCSSTQCHMTAHMTCLAGRFLDSQNEQDALIPSKGHCPQCARRLSWSDLVREVSLRSRGEEQVRKLLGRPGSEVDDSSSESALTSDTPSDDENIESRDVAVHTSKQQSKKKKSSRKKVPMKSSSMASQAQKPLHNPPGKNVIEDSDFDDVEEVLA